MDLFKQHLAPIAESAWAEINETAIDVIETTLSARKALRVVGPLGLAKQSVANGTLNMLSESNTKKDDQVFAGLYDVTPLVETRLSFELSRWELDNALRGKQDLDLDVLEQAAEQLARFEENCIYNGHKAAGIKGLVETAPHKLRISDDANETLQAIATGLLKLQDAYTQKPYVLIVGDEVFTMLHRVYDGKLLIDALASLVGGAVIHSKVLDGALLVPYDHEDLEITIGQDYAIGYEAHDAKNVRLFITNAFTFRILDPNLIVYFKYYK
ncbi:MAG: bacteriocin [Acholeplasmatales bacterium]|nr:MAG: bacteriocin [Acholeplasmatales bacterium]